MTSLELQLCIRQISISLQFAFSSATARLVRDGSVVRCRRRALSRKYWHDVNAPDWNDMSLKVRPAQHMLLTTKPIARIASTNVVEQNSPKTEMYRACTTATRTIFDLETGPGARTSNVSRRNF